MTIYIYPLHTVVGCTPFVWSLSLRYDRTGNGSIVTIGMDEDRGVAPAMMDRLQSKRAVPLVRQRRRNK